jgi:alkylated DNA repair dioxygenase AlkB
MEAPVEYISLFPLFDSKEHANNMGNAINEEVEWVQRGNTPRREAFYCKYPTDYFYGNAEYGRSYSANINIPSHLKAVWDVLEGYYGVKYEACFLNKYEHAREHLGWHADDSDSIDDNRPIAVISFGAERELWFRKNGTGGVDAIEKLLLENGSMCLMLPGMQDTHQHRIPKHDRECGTRISLTFRGLVNAET